MSPKCVFKLSKLVQKAFLRQKSGRTLLLHHKMDEIKWVEESHEYVIGSFIQDLQAINEEETWRARNKRAAVEMDMEDVQAIKEEETWRARNKRPAVEMEMEEVLSQEIDRIIAEPPPDSAIVVLEMAVNRMHEEVTKFTDYLISHMLAAEWDLEAATDAIEPGIELSLPSHKKYVFNSFVAHCIMEGFEDPLFDLSGVNRNNMNINMFQCFCQNKFRRLVHPKMEESFLKENMEMGQELYANFLVLAKAVWVFHSLALSLDPPACIFEAERGIPFSPYSMQDIVPAHTPHLHVGFTVMPGVHVGNKVIKCLVYTVTSSTLHQ